MPGNDFFGPDFLREFMAPRRADLPVERALLDVGTLSRRANKLIEAARVAPPRVAATLFEQCRTVCLEQAEAFGAAARLVADMDESLEVAAERAARKGRR